MIIDEIEYIFESSKIGEGTDVYMVEFGTKGYIGTTKADAEDFVKSYQSGHDEIWAGSGLE